MDLLACLFSCHVIACEVPEQAVLHQDPRLDTSLRHILCHNAFPLSGCSLSIEPIPIPYLTNLFCSSSRPLPASDQ